MLLSINISEQLELFSLNINQKSFDLLPKEHSFGEEAAPAFLDVYVEEDIQKIPVMFNLVIETKGDYTYRNYFFKRDGDKFINFDVPKLSDYYNVRTEGIATYYLTDKPIRVPREVLMAIRREFPDNNQLKVSNDHEDAPRCNAVTLTLKLDSGSLVSYMGTIEPTQSTGCNLMDPIYIEYQFKLIEIQRTTAQGEFDLPIGELDDTLNSSLSEPSLDEAEEKESIKVEHSPCNEKVSNSFNGINEHPSNETDKDLHDEIDDDSLIPMGETESEKVVSEAIVENEYSISDIEEYDESYKKGYSPSNELEGIESDDIEELPKEELYKEELYKEELYKEELPKEELYKEELYKEELYKEELYKEELYKEELVEIKDEEEDKCYIEVLGRMKSLKHSIESDFITSQTLISELQNLIKEGKEMTKSEYKGFYGKMREAYEKLLNLKISISSLKTVTNDAKKLTKKVPKSLRNKFKNEVKENKGFVSNQDDQQKTLESTMKSLQKALIAKRLTDPLSIELLQEDYNQLIEKSRVFMNLIRDHELYVKHQLQKLEEMMEGHDVFTDKELYSKLWHRNFHTKDIIAKMAGFAGSQRILLNEAERLKQLMIEETGKTTDTGFNVINEMYSEGKLMHEKLTKQYEDVTARLRKIPLRKQKQVITKAEPTTEEVAEAEA
ncbi:hypothetical protein BdWA1_000006 [Babesia duncani]|uniref:Uncharacterized protein n=1 Tax=Babesia duncani TaxID=323732 RepID=A0AAD9PM93_9APIC|nr:hypothetical protein BdWA1_000006 [Babesia duncani]